eukprot:COSAG05_NODE_229_length_13378_cov_4.728594_1_plen_42_part_10
MGKTKIPLGVCNFRGEGPKTAQGKTTRGGAEKGGGRGKGVPL